MGEIWLSRRLISHSACLLYGTMMSFVLLSMTEKSSPAVLKA